MEREPGLLQGFLRVLNHRIHQSSGADTQGARNLYEQVEAWRAVSEFKRGDVAFGDTYAVGKLLLRQSGGITVAPDNGGHKQFGKVIFIILRFHPVNIMGVFTSSTNNSRPMTIYCWSPIIEKPFGGTEVEQASALFKAKLFPVVIMLLIAFILPGCSAPQKPQQVQRVVPVPQVQFVEATLIEGKTTKQEVLDVFGMPEDIGTSLDYKFKGDMKARLTIVQKDGTTYNVILGDGEKYNRLSVSFYGHYDNQGRNIPSNINTHITVH